MNRGLTVRMHAPLWTSADPYVDVVVAMNRKDAPRLACSGSTPTASCGA
jgi:hypothetical protein